MNIIVSVSVRKGVVAILIIENNTIKVKNVSKIKDESIAASNYLSIIYAFTLALRQLRNYIEVHSDNRNICFETSNSIFIKWIANQYSKEEYQEEFVKFMKLLQELPIRFNFTYVAKPKALPFCDEKYIKKVSLEGLNLED